VDDLIAEMTSSVSTTSMTSAVISVAPFCLVFPRNVFIAFIPALSVNWD
jgi:hypothetical protein